MFKLVIKETGYKLSEYDEVREVYNTLCVSASIQTVEKYVEVFKQRRIREGEVREAIRFMSDTNHNVAEFGTNGFFTVSYYCDKEER